MVLYDIMVSKIYGHKYPRPSPIYKLDVYVSRGFCSI